MNKPVGSKLSKLKEWLTLPDAAKHLTCICNDEVTEAEILQLALGGRLRLSVYFVNNVYARACSLVDIGTIDKMPAHSVLPHNDSNFFVSFEDSIVQINNVWDLTMCGNENIDIQNKWNTLVNNPDMTCRRLSCLQSGDEFFVGVLVMRDAKVYQLLINTNEALIGGRRNLSFDPNGGFIGYPAYTLPKNIVLVVRSESLLEFEQLVDSNEIEEVTIACRTLSKSELPNDKSTQLRALNQASLLWSNADRDDKTTWTDTNTVVNFLIDKGFSNSLAKRGASIVRPDWAESGARPKE